MKRTHAQEDSSESGESLDLDSLELLQQEIIAQTEQIIAGLKFARAAGRLSILEAGHAIKSIPSLILIWITLWQMVVIGWLLALGLIGWVTFELSSSVALALCASFATQLGGISICYRRITLLKARFSFCKTKHLFAVAKEASNEQNY